MLRLALVLILCGRVDIMSLNVKNKFWMLLVLCIFLLAFTIFLRAQYSNGLFIDSESYKSIRYASEFKEEGIISYDKLSYGGKPFFEEYGWYLLLSISPGFLAKYLPLLFGIFSFILFYFIINKIRPDLVTYASLLLLVSPSFLYLFSVATKYVASLFFILLGFYLMLIKRNNFAYFSFFVSGFFSIVGLFIIFLGYAFYIPKSKKYFDSFVLFSAFIIAFLIQFYRIFSLGLPSTIFGFDNFTISGFFSFLIFGLSNKYFGINFFILILSLIGIYVFYNDKYKFLFYYLLLFLFLFISFFIPFFIVYIVFILAFFAAVGLIEFLRGDMKSELFRFLTLLVIFCGIIFSLLVFYVNVGNFEPTNKHFEAFDYLKEQGGNAVVLSDYKEGPYIAFAGKSSFMDNVFIYAPEVLERNRDINALFDTIDLELSSSILKKYNVEYIIITQDMRRNVFNNKEYGLLYLLKYDKNRFVKVFGNEEVEIWYNRPI